MNMGYKSFGFHYVKLLFAQGSCATHLVFINEYELQSAVSLYEASCGGKAGQSPPSSVEVSTCRFHVPLPTQGTRHREMLPFFSK